jgi:tripartite ATP-independent transporter DctM subunit
VIGTGLVLLIVFIGAFVLGFPVCISIGLGTAAGMVFSGNAEFLYTLPQQMARGTQSHSLLALPYFILAANIMNETGITNAIFDFASAVVGHIRGGLAQVNVLASMLFAGIQGSTVADVAGLGTVEIEAMTKKGYDRLYSALITIASSIVGPIIPPSLSIVIYGILSGESIGRLFLAGAIPGIMFGMSLMVLNYVFSYTRAELFPVPEKRVSLQELLRVSKSGLLALTAPLLIVGSLLLGFATATEAGLIAIAYCLSISFFFAKPREVLALLPRALLNSALTTSIIMFILSFSTSMGWLVAFERIPNAVANAMLNIAPNKYILLLMLNMFYLLIGTVITGIPALLITLPIILPVVDAFHISRLHFGIIVNANLCIGTATPPMGTGLYIMTEVAKLRFEDMARSIWIFLIPLLVVLAIITYIPQIVLFLPDLLD